MRKNLLLSLVVVCISVLGMSNVSAQTYNKGELKNMRDFLLYKSEHQRPAGSGNYPYNYEILCGSLTPAEIAALNSATGWETTTSWMGKIGGVTFSSNRISKIDWNNLNTYTGLSGILNLDACSELIAINFPQNLNYTTSITLNGAKLTSATVQGTAATSYLTSFDIIMPNDENHLDMYGFPALLVETAPSNPGVNCMYNKLTFANMPKTRVIDNMVGSFNFYYCASQQVSQGNENQLNTPLSLVADYEVTSTFGGTKYSKLKYSSNNADVPTSYYSQVGGIFTFNSTAYSVLDGQKVYCDMTNDLFWIKDGEKNGNFYFETGTPSYSNLTLRYETTLKKGTDTGISNPEKNLSSIYFANNTLNIITEVSLIQSVVVFDLSGKQVFNTICNTNAVSADASTWQKGVYVVKVSTADNSYTQKVIK